MIRRSKQHLHEAGESYWHHLRFAFRYAASCMVAGLMALMHGMIPALFTTSASRKVQQLANRKRDE